MTKLQQIREIIIKSNPKINKGFMECSECKKLILGGGIVTRDRPIRLADVLLLIEDIKPTITITDPDTIDYGKEVTITEEEMTKLVSMWNLIDDNLDNQKEETWDFIISLLPKV